MSSDPMLCPTAVETALNSRCSSGAGDPRKGHWGLYDEAGTVTPAEKSVVLSAANVPRFTARRLCFDSASTPIMLCIEDGMAGIESDWLHVESGMQHQAVHLACAALGLGTCIYNTGEDGSSLGDGRLATARMGLARMRPTFDGALWTTDVPGGDHPWQTGGLPDPKRSGEVSLIRTLCTLETKRDGRKAVWPDDAGQLLWAARGRTPHGSFCGREWGLTIPTWCGGEGYTTAYLLTQEATFLYINWQNERPTHSLRRLSATTSADVSKACGWTARHLLAFGVNEDKKRALWEVGYELIGAMAQAVSLGVGYEAKLLSEGERSTLEGAGITRPIAALLI